MIHLPNSGTKKESKLYNQELNILLSGYNDDEKLLHYYFRSEIFPLFSFSMELDIMEIRRRGGASYICPRNHKNAFRNIFCSFSVSKSILKG